MAGIIDSKSRVMDVGLTLEGRRQLSELGKLDAQFISFSDGQAFYEADAVSGSSDAGARLYLEMSPLMSDVVAFESFDDGQLIAKSGFFNEGVGLHNGKLVSATAGVYLQQLTGSAFITSASNLLGASLNNFQNQMPIGSTGVFDDDSDFLLSLRNIDFGVTNSKPISVVNGKQNLCVDATDEFFVDEKLSHLENFRYLPPQNWSEDGEGTQLGVYPPFGAQTKLEPDDLAHQLSTIRDRGFMQDIEFIATSRNNNIMMQLFELTNTDVKKLDIIDFGLHINEKTNKSERIFFAGKIFSNSSGIMTYAHIFTLVLADA